VVRRHQGRADTEAAKEERAPHAIFIMARFADGYVFIELTGNAL
jgi:hypothetical protein